MSINIGPPAVEELRPRITVIGVGGAGGNAIANMIEAQIEGVDFIVANTDAQALNASIAEHRIQLGPDITQGLGAGSRPEVGRAAAEETLAEIERALDGVHMVFIAAGMGGGTGTGAAPIVAKVAKEMGILTVGVVTKPFEFEGGRRMSNADQGMQELEANVDSLIVVLNEKLLELPGGEDMTQDEAFAHANDVLKNAVGGIAEIINVPGHVNVDFEDVRTVMGEPGKAMMGTAMAKGPDRARIAAEQAVACPLLEGIDLSGAKGVLVLVTAAKGSLKLSESKLAMSTINAYASPDAHVIYGAAYDESLGDQLRVTVIATGLSPARRVQTPIQVVHSAPVQRTGTLNGYPELSGQRIRPYTDLLLHDMGPGLADGRPDFLAGPRDWRTSPLWGIGLIGTVNGDARFLHDGRARDLAEAILWHGGEAESARERFRHMARDDRAAMLRFLQSL